MIKISPRIKRGLLAFAAVAGFYASASAGVVTKQLVDYNGTDSGWSVTWVAPDPVGVSSGAATAIPPVNADVVVDAVVGSSVYIEIAKDFQLIDRGTNLSTVEIRFRQTKPDAVSTIVINDEIVRNLTGVDWSGFSMSLTNISGPSPSLVQFDTTRTSTHQGGFNITPFTSTAFAGGNQEVNFGGGIVPSNPSLESIWAPGNRGALFINAAPDAQTPREFTLTETATLVPEPGTFAVAFAAAGMLLIRRRKQA